MPKFIYHRMAESNTGWRFPSPRNGYQRRGDDYVSQHGFGFEDWNFDGQTWDDGLLHLYLKGEPAKKYQNETFNIVLVTYSEKGFQVIGLAENVQLRTAELDEKIWERRARDLVNLAKSGATSNILDGKSIPEVVKLLTTGDEKFKWALKKEDLHILEKPIPVAALQTSWQPKATRYKHYRLSELVYSEISKAITDREPTYTPSAPDSWPEGALVEKLHRSRERKQGAPKKAKSEFIQQHGSLFCEACGLRPEETFKDDDLKNSIIEAHHKVPISELLEPTETTVDDFAMLCPTCHRAIHKIRPYLTVEGLKAKLDR